MAVTDFANEAAALTAGWKVVKVQVGSTFICRFEKPVTGAGQSGNLAKAEGTSTVSQGAADTAALAALNAQRRHRYAGSPGRASGSAESPDARGATHTVDAT